MGQHRYKIIFTNNTTAEVYADDFYVKDGIFKFYNIDEKAEVRKGIAWFVQQNINAVFNMLEEDIRDQK